MSIIVKTPQDIVTKYRDAVVSKKAEDNVELEIRFKTMSADTFKILVETAKNKLGTGVVETTVNIISENVFEQLKDEIQYIRQLTFTNGIKAGDVHLTKKRLIKSLNVSDHAKYSIGIALETRLSEPFSSKPDALVRYKARVSYKVDNWRLDLTAVKQTNLRDLGTSGGVVREKFFPADLTVDNFSKIIPQGDQFEAELEYMGNADLSLEDFTVAKKVFQLLDPNYLNVVAYGDEMEHVAKYMSRPDPKMYRERRIKQLLPQVQSLSKNTYYANIYPADGYYATVKADGQRGLLSINGNRVRLLLNQEMREWMNGETYAPGDIYIADCELVESSSRPDALTPSTATLWVFDCMVVRDERMISNIADRISRIPEVCKVASGILGDALLCKPKPYVVINAKTAKAQFTELWTSPAEYSRDGIVMTPPTGDYYSTISYKWKPFEQNSIDCLAMKCPVELMGIKPYIEQPGMTLYFLFVGIDHKVRTSLGLGLVRGYNKFFPEPPGRYYPVQLSLSAAPYAYLYYDPQPTRHGKIIELTRRRGNIGQGLGDWEFNRVREDREMSAVDFGNDYRIAEITFSNYIDIFELNDLWAKSTGYFSDVVTPIYSAPNKFKRLVIKMILRKIVSNARWVVDLASGRGADLFWYREFGVRNVLFTDIDAGALSELTRRKFEIASWDNRKSGGASESVVTRYDRLRDVEYEKIITRDSESMTIHTLVVDLKTPVDEFVDMTIPFGVNAGLVDCVVCNFALHYMCDTLSNLKNILNIVSRLLKVGGIFMFTVMDGKIVYDLLNTTPTWTSMEGDIVKYQIKQEYRNGPMTAVGQLIKVKLPFSAELYSEPLCNIDTVITEGKKLGLNLEVRESFRTYLGEFEKNKPQFHNQLTPADIEYAAMHAYVTMRKIKR
jgi:SAM-dependent methyltransferase